MNKFTLPVRFAFALTTSLIAYFLILSLFGLHTNPFFSLFNGVITGFAIFEAIRYRRLETGEDYNYTTGFSAGLITGFIASILFTIFMSIYATELEPTFLDELVTEYANHYDVGIATFSFIVLLMGLATTVVLTLAFMQLFKNKLKK
ncbi:DUF4199 domain-containing protein [Psychroflexus planctonicus]|uniref:DUF4199 domain-containing protein n=1 Tax=Psychroflexus planctonicus TaxID=1526575 RepID=A0ABQ1SIL2_9FLAO|nr:DUF4199 domain-containing protein [Psychroflexus planctonicus]GGE34826.1 hypothetical protein GCM10010832_13750 [Psychroflexus planctonicus]